MYRKLCLASCVSVLLALPLACSTGSPSPTSPTTAAGVGSPGAFGPDNSTLKVTAPTPTSPIDDVEIEGYKPEMAAANATGHFVNATGLQYRLFRAISFGAELTYIDAINYGVPGGLNLENIKDGVAAVKLTLTVHF